MISIKNVKKIFPSKKGNIVAVDDVSLEIEEGEIFGIIGYSGAGKSTLIRMLNGLELPSSGSVNVGEQEISKIKGRQLRKARQEISMIFQHFNLLWSRTVRDNIAFPLEIAGVSKKNRLKRVDELIGLVGLKGKEDAYPSQLSGGQKQRVGIARALANNPKVLLCDEATSALDPQTTDSILDLLVDINRRLKLTIVIITHEMHVIRKICDMVAVMEDGKVVESGSVLEVFKKPQQEITKRFVQQVTDPYETNVIRIPATGKTVKLTFTGEAAEQNIVTNLIRDFALDVRILQGKMENTGAEAYGTLFLHLDGDQEVLSEAVGFLHRQEEIRVEVIGNV
ncbi:ATP-binding cassette domain-containing protein [Bacillaceae bacterium Marseille-Q3522]|nr:ATP-binding cassette domain-containing protein [Bacillaceae bacterium Marseille-Q3522]